MRLRFDDLPRRIRERIVELSRNPADPHVLTHDSGIGGGWFKYFTLIAGGAVCFFCLQFLVQRSHHNIAPYHDREVFMGLAGGVALMLISVASIVFVKLYPPPPYKTGQWALTSYLMRLSRGWVELFPLSQLGKPTIVTVMRNGSYSRSRLELDGGFTFYFTSKQAVEQACGKILAARELLSKALSGKDPRALVQLDPFSECTLSGVWTSPGGADPEGPKSPLVPGAARAIQWLGSLAAGGGVAAAAFMVFQSIYKGG
jgi:hypothetical protein